MPKISLDNLERYHGHLKDWYDARFAEKKVHENWHEAGPSGAVSFYPVPNRPIDPVVNFAFTETLPEGTKAPDNPSTITGVTNVAIGRSGKNLLTPKTSSVGTLAGGVITVTSDGEITVNGTLSAQTNVPFEFPFDSPKVISAGSYMLSANNNKVPSPEVRLSTRTTNGGWPTDGTVNGTNNLINSINYTKVITFSANHNAARIYAIFSAGTYDNLTLKPQLETGSLSTAWEPSGREERTIPLNGTYYGGSVDLSAGTMTVMWYGEQISDAYTIYETNYTNTLVVGLYATKGHEGNIPNISNYLVTDKFPSINGSEDVEHCRFSGGVGVARHVFNIYVNKSRLDVSSAVDPSSPTDAEWFAAARAWMQNNPVFACYSLFTPEIVQLTPTQIYSLSQSDPYTLRINTVYSDQQSVLVRYPKSPIITGSELDNAILSLGGD